MVFSSLEFLFLFLPLGMAGYYLLRSRKARNVWLLLISLAFYAWGEPVYVVLMVASIVANWAIALAMGPVPASDGSDRDRLRRKVLLTVAVALNVLAIGFFKYEGFLADNVNALVGSELVPNLRLPLPIGISFYTLQALSYAVDVYRGDVLPQRSLVCLGMYVACFPQLVAGPIVRYKTVEEQVEHRVETLERFHTGARLFVVGFAKKVLLANVCAILADRMLAMGGPSVGLVGAWGGSLPTRSRYSLTSGATPTWR